MSDRSPHDDEVIEVTEVSETPRHDDEVSGAPRLDRRRAIAGVAGAGVAVAVPPPLPGNTGTLGGFGLGRPRAAARRPSDGGAFANRDDRYAQSSGRLADAGHATAPPPPFRH